MKSNPFLVTLSIITLVVAGGLLAFGFIKKSEYDKKKNAFQSLSSQLGKMESMEGYPNQENVDKLKTTLVSYKGKIEGLRNALESSSIPAFKNVVPAPKGATGKLNYQLGSLEWLHKSLAEHNPQELRNLHRKPLKEERGAGEGGKKNKKNSRAVEPIAVSLPIQMTFVAYENDARGFLNSLVKSNEYLFTIDSIKFKLLTEAEETDEDDEEANNIEEENPEDSFDSIFSSEEEPEEGAGENGGLKMPEKMELSDDKLFNQVLGQEKVAVFLDMNLVYFQTQ